MGLDTFFTPRLTELGRIKIGGKGAERPTKAGGTFRLPEKHDFFSIATMQRNGAGDMILDTDLEKQLAVKYASPDGKLRQLPIRLLSDDPEEIMQSAYVWYGGKTIGARSDGKTITWFNDPATGARLKEPKVEPWNDAMLDLKDGRGVKLLKLHTTFNCVVAAPEARWGGVYKFRTTSIISGSQLYGSLVETLRLTGGVLVGMPLMLVVRPIQVAPDGKPTTVYVVHVELRGAEMKAIQDQALVQMRYAVEFKGQMEASRAQYRKMIAAPGENESEDDAKDITDEFHPEADGSAEARPAPPKEADPLLQQATATEIVNTETGEVIEAEIIPPTAQEEVGQTRESTIEPAPDSLTDKSGDPLIDESRKASLRDLFSKCRARGYGKIPFEAYLSETFGITNMADIPKLTSAQAEDAIKHLESKNADLKAKAEESKQ